MLMCNRFNLMQIFKWTIEMVDDLLHALGEFKANMEYRNVDFNAEKAKQYEAVRKAMARRYSFGDVNLFRPQETTAIPEDFQESQRKELEEKVKSEKALIKKCYSRVMENVEELWQKFSNAVKTGSRIGSGKKWSCMFCGDYKM